MVISAMRDVESRKGQQLAEKVRLHEIVNRVLDSDSASDWVPVYGGVIADVFTSGPRKELLDLCHRNIRLQQDRSNRNTEASDETESEKVLVTSKLSMWDTI